MRKQGAQASEATGHHDHDHGHGHDHSHVPSSMKALIIVITLTLTIFFAELIAGLVSGSLALLSDAMHMLSDSTGLLIALVAMLIGRRPATRNATYGYRRIEVFAALVNATVVSAVSIWIVVQAILRLGGHHHIDTNLMLLVAVIGFTANAISALILMRQRHESLNMRGAFLHVLSDMVASVAVIIAGLVIRFTGWMPADTIASLLIAAIILPRSFRLLRDAMAVLLDRVPRDIELTGVEQALVELDGVREVHDLHVWSLDGKETLATCHLVLVDADSSPADAHSCGILDEAQEVLTSFGISHSTIQLEATGHSDHETVC